MKPTRKDRLMPGGVPKYVRCYDNGGGFTHFCRKCFVFFDAHRDNLCPTKNCGNRLIGPVDGGTFDRYTVIYTGHYKGRSAHATEYVGMSCSPFHPQGFGQHGELDSYKYEGGWPPAYGDKIPGGPRRIPFEVLPDDCKRLVIRAYMANWGLFQNPNQTTKCKKPKTN